MTDDELVRLFWGKAGRAKVPVVHPALFHMLDVGMAARALLDGAPAQALRHLVGGEASVEVAAALPFLVSLHDLGKISPGFEHQREDLCGPIREAGFKFPRHAVEEDHARITLEHLKTR